MLYPPKPRSGDRVAIVSPSSGLPQIFPEVYELGLRRLREELALEPVEYPTTRVLGAPAQERARDLHAAFADPTITAVLATIGGDDQITVLRHLDPELLRANPKPFFGYSDNTNLLSYLFGLGIVGYHGGSVMVHLGRAGAITRPTCPRCGRRCSPRTGTSCRRPRTGATRRCPGANRSGSRRAADVAARGLAVAQRRGVVEAPTWGGNIEILSWLLQANLVTEPAPRPRALPGDVRGDAAGDRGLPHPAQPGRAGPAGRLAARW